MVPLTIPGPVLVAVDGSQDAYVAASAAADLVAATGGHLHLVHVVREPAEEWGMPVEALLTFRRRRARRIIADHAAQVEELNVDVAESHLVEGNPVDGILDVAHDVGAALIVVGSRGRSERRVPLLGSVADSLVHHSPIALLVLRGAESWPPHHVVIGDDGSGGAAAAARLGAVIAQATGASILLVRALPDLAHVLEQPRMLDGDRAAEIRTCIDSSLGDRATSLAAIAAVPISRRVVIDDAAGALTVAAREPAGTGMVAVGRRGLGRVQRLRLGSVSLAVLHAAPGAVLVVPEADG